MIKDFSIPFSRVIIIQDFETVTFYVLFQSCKGYVEVKINKQKIW